MRYFNRKIGSEWKEFRLNSEEVKTVLALSASASLRTLTVIDAVAKKFDVALKPEERLAIFSKLAPSYNDIAVDFIVDQLEKTRAVEKQKTAVVA